MNLLCRPRPPAGEGGSLSRGPHRGHRVPSQLHTLPGQLPLHFYQAGLNTTTQAQLSREGLRESFATFIEWVLVSCESPLTVDIADDDTSPTLDPEPSPPSSRCAERKPEPTADGEPVPAATEPSPERATEPKIALESA